MAITILFTMKSIVTSIVTVTTLFMCAVSQASNVNHTIDSDVVMIINYGQSLSVGGSMNKNYADFHNMLTFNGGSNEWASNVDITNADIVEEYYGSQLYEIEKHKLINYNAPVSANALAWMKKLADDGTDVDKNRYQLLGSAPGYSGASINTFVKDASKTSPYTGFNCYERLLFSVKKGKELANKEGKSFSVGAIFWVQGEADTQRTEEWYYNMIKQLITDLNTDIKSITGQKNDIAFIIYQMSSCLEPNEEWQSRKGPSCETWLSLQLALEGQKARENGSDDISRLVYYGSSMYQYDYGTDLYHPLDRTIVGLQAGINAKKIVNDNDPYPVFFIKNYSICEDSQEGVWTLKLKFDVPVKPMRFYYPDDGYHNVNGKQENFGFRLVDENGNSIIASEPEIEDGDVLMIKCNKNPSGCKLSYAVSGHFGGGNLCDSQNEQFVINNKTYTIDNFCPSFKDYMIDIDDAESYSYSVPLGANGYSTYCGDHNFTVTSGAKAYTATIKGTSVVLDKIADGTVIGKGEGVILIGDEGKNAVLTLSANDAVTFSDNILQGVNDETGSIKDNAFVLSTNTNGLTAFVNPGEYNKVSDLMNKAYIVYDASQIQTLPIVISDDATTVDNVVSTTPASAPFKIHSIDGRLLSAPKNGLNILKMSDGTTRKVVK